ncbi:MAG: hypothetical protein ACOY0T_38425 [Myxococcota bacterium]
MQEQQEPSVLLMAGIASLATTAAAVSLSQRDTGHAAAAFNATSHILWGERAAKVDRFDVKHTVAGTLLNAGAMLSWAAVYRLLPNAKSVAAIVTKGALVSALAYVTDYHVVPKRLTPGFEERLSAKSMAAIYGVLAASLALGDWLSSEEAA